jgi:uncharacterized protein (TIGR02466 family)
MTTLAPQVQVAPLFAVPLAKARHPSPDALNKALREVLLARESEGDRHKNQRPSMKTTGGVFESEFQLFNTDEPHISELRDFCWRVLTRVVKDLSGYPPEFMRQLRIHASAWFHVTRPGGYFGLHNHGMASWSGVYCVDGGDGGQELPDSALLTFNNPASTAAMFIDAAVANIKPPFDTNGRSFKLQSGDLVIFPSWLQHQVTPHRGPGERITVAFNAWFRQDSAGAAAT